MKILIVSGEISGDIYGAKIAQEILRQNSSVTLFGIGGDRLKEICHNYIFDIAHNNAIGITERFSKRKLFKELFKSITAFLKETKIDKVVLIDFQHYNFKLASLFQEFNIPITTFITPNFWIWDDLKKVRKVVDYSDKIITIFKKEYELYKRFYPSVYYFGHPLIEMLQPEIKQTSEIDKEKKVITLFPGSRTQEIDLLLPKMLETIRILYEENPNKYIFYIKISSKRFMPLIVKYLKEKKASFVRIWERDPEKIFSHSDVIISSTGSASLETVLHNVPLIILGALSPLTFFAAWHLLKIQPEFIALPNIIAEEEIIPEYMQDKIIPEDIAKKTKYLLQPKAKKELLSKYDAIRKDLQETEHPLENICKTILS
jgi:lipid-A-disaccharide synthase